MRSARVTVLMSPDEKAEVEASAARLGISSGEYIRLAVDNFDKPTAAEEAELAALVAQVNEAVPKMAATLDRMIESTRAMRADIRKTIDSLSVRA